MHLISSAGFKFQSETRVRDTHMSLVMRKPIFAYGMKHTVQEFLLHHDLLGVQIFHIIEKGLFIVQMIKSKANNVCMRGQDN